MNNKELEQKRDETIKNIGCCQIQIMHYKRKIEELYIELNDINKKLFKN